jgi:hypothetical protein
VLELEADMSADQVFVIVLVLVCVLALVGVSIQSRRQSK